MSALAGCAVDNAVVELSGPEVPVMDGSAAPFVFLIECAGTTAQDAPRRALEILKEVTVADTRRSASVTSAGSSWVSSQPSIIGTVITACPPGRRMRNISASAAVSSTCSST